MITFFVVHLDRWNECAPSFKTMQWSGYLQVPMLNYSAENSLCVLFTKRFGVGLVWTSACVRIFCYSYSVSCSVFSTVFVERECGTYEANEKKITFITASLCTTAPGLWYTRLTINKFCICFSFFKKWVNGSIQRRILFLCAFYLLIHKLEINKDIQSAWG